MILYNLATLLQPPTPPTPESVLPAGEGDPTMHFTSSLHDSYLVDIWGPLSKAKTVVSFCCLPQVHG